MVPPDFILQTEALEALQVAAEAGARKHGVALQCARSDFAGCHGPALVHVREAGQAAPERWSALVLTESPCLMGQLGIHARMELWHRGAAREKQFLDAMLG